MLEYAIISNFICKTHRLSDVATEDSQLGTQSEDRKVNPPDSLMPEISPCESTVYKKSDRSKRGESKHVISSVRTYPLSVLFIRLVD